MNDKQSTTQVKENVSQPKNEPSIDNTKSVASTSNGQPRSKKGGLLVAGALVLGLLGGFTGSWIHNFLAGSESPLTVLNTAEDDGNTTVTASEESISSVAKAVSPSVVSIVTSTERSSFFNERTFQQEGAGTGMIVSSNGYILTNEHVVEGADTVSVVLPNGNTYDNVRVLGSDPLNDLAFLKIDRVSNLPAVTLGDSKTIRIGQSVVAIGNALGQYQNSVTSGIISGTGRPVVASTDGTPGSNPESLTDLIQTDAAINSGNSGGPLLNLKGQVVGINTAVAQNAQGIGFAIPIGAAKGMLAHVIKTGKVERTYLGVQYVPITPEAKEEYDLPVNQGGYVVAQRGTSVQKNGPADKAGVKDKDIIIAINGDKVGDVASVGSLVSEYEPGDRVELTILRDGRERKLTATLGTYNN